MRAARLVLHIAGERDFRDAPAESPASRLRAARRAADFGDALAAADLAISRAGGTVWELAAAGTPSILVPYPHATADHQALNARYFERGEGRSWFVRRSSHRVPALVDELLGDSGPAAER